MLHAIEVNNNAVKTLFRSCMYIIDSKHYCFIGFPFTLLLIQIYMVNYIQKDYFVYNLVIMMIIIVITVDSYFRL